MYQDELCVEKAELVFGYCDLHAARKPEQRGFATRNSTKPKTPACHSKEDACLVAREKE
jgi:hypothetical protein